MSRILRVTEGDYRVKVQDAGSITLDTGLEQGTVIITGDLLVKGNTTTVDTANLNIEDNLILLNKGESGAGVTEGTAGLEIERGSLENAQFLWDESIDKFKIQLDTDVLSGIVVGNIATDPTTNLEFDMQSGPGTLRITNSTGYESRVLDPDDIPNRQYVTDYVFASGGSAVVSLIQYPVGASYGNADTMVEALSSSIKIWVDPGTGLSQVAQFSNNGLDVDNVNILENTILNSDPAEYLILTAASTHVQIDGVLNLKELITAPTSTGGDARLYAKSVAVGEEFNSGVFIANSRTQDEIVVKNRALLLSMLF
jgi:hypothetical protein